ncbi:hypothetical protein V1512DRAFT_231498 [Lipomyces arxii]|uniref:uncharacterized protein n=1 Tax=Lipomyces arxii TaxID=56418 RepID=UPI0034D003DF
MRFSSTLLLTVAASVPVLGHFNLVYPASRGLNHETQTNAPCGGKNSFSSIRTLFNPDGSPIATVTSHSDSGVEVRFCPSTSDCSTNEDFNVTLVDTLYEVGAGNFCLPNVSIDHSIYPSNRTSYLNGTIQVIYFSDDGELYNCADISISLAGDDSSSLCTNATGIRTYDWAGSLAASEASVGEDSSSASPNPSSVATATSSSSGAGQAVVASGLLALAISALTAFLV